jgi:hypothetical protein
MTERMADTHFRERIHLAVTNTRRRMDNCFHNYNQIKGGKKGEDAKKKDHKAKLKDL